ncbi:MAG: PEP-CTERM sorting domain-containing protein [Planctomycetales bacterium]|nr:PEP-CTERM sorting domain-containing protein [Planctomycetales bacterium]
MTSFALLALATPAWAISLDGIVIDGDTPGGGVALSTQTVNTQFGNSTSGNQNSGGGSELNQLFAEINPTTKKLEIGITGNLEGNNNKLFIFIDAVAGGETTLLNDNADGGFGEINAQVGLQFMGASMDHGLRLDLGGGNLDVNFFDLIDNSGTSIIAGAGPGDLPISNGGGARGILVGWDNSNVDGVSGDSGGPLVDPTTATKGFEFEIDIIDAFNGSQGDINLMAFVTSGDAKFASNQFLPTSGSTSNIGNGINTFNAATITVTGAPIIGFLDGDVDGDGDVDLFETDNDMLSDFDIIRNNWLETNASFGQTLLRTDGDLNQNGIVSIEDFREFKDNCQDCTPQELIAAFRSLGVSAPEPAGVGLVMLVGMGGMLVRRRNG